MNITLSRGAKVIFFKKVDAKYSSRRIRMGGFFWKEEKIH